MEKSRRNPHETHTKPTRNQHETKTKPTRNRHETDTKPSGNTDDKTDIKMGNRMKFLGFNKAVVYICNEIKHEKKTVNIYPIMKLLQVKRVRAWRILEDLRGLNFLYIRYKANFNEYYGVFNSSNLKLERFVERAKQNIEDSPVKKKKGGGKNENRKSQKIHKRNLSKK